MIKGSVKYKHYAIVTLICMILMSGFFVAETQFVNEKVKATITGFSGCTKKNHYAKGKYGKTQYTLFKALAIGTTLPIEAASSGNDVCPSFTV